MSRPALEVTGVAVEIDGSRILDGVSVTVEPGQLLSLIGPNGAGKSTLIRCLAGLISPSEGDVLLDGRSLGGLSRRAIARSISYVPQADARSLPFAVRAFVEMGRYPHLGPWSALSAADVEAVDAALAQTDTVHLSARSMESLSGGERQRVLIAAALAQGGRILLLDEPTTFLDYRHQMWIVELLERLHRDQGLTVVTATHDLNWALAVSDAVLALRDGTVAYRGATAALFDAGRLEEIYGTRFDLVESGGRPVPLVVPARNGS
ncbi:MAG TPA: ABC transporter ATP-binding protein [Thermoanaerobaculales bacterium]|nr:ABC transporter ATP-binding protein [Thermoanaerobaculales bacterium]HQN97154.1 ABC transporter ATP-binding protein [Thermoanaerobaculales bacterium]HQP42801.1 ABC transporter ATP-binding protein [Thermoanaerobaculales bacterium]